MTEIEYIEFLLNHGATGSFRERKLKELAELKKLEGIKEDDNCCE